MAKLFDPVKIGNVEMRNRLVMLGMTMGMSQDYSVSDRYINFMVARAKGGVGLAIIGSALPVDFSNTKPACHETPFGVGIWSDAQIPGLLKLTKAMHDNGAKIAAQVTLHYEWRANKDSQLGPVGPSDTMDYMGVGKPRAMTVEEIKTMVEQFGDASRRAREAGFDMVEFNFGMGYLINRFISPLSNKRTDEYGGSLENRMRIVLDIIANARKKTAPDFPLIARMTGDEFLEGGNKLEDVVKMIPMLEKAGINAINLQAGWHESPLPLVQQWVPSGKYVYFAEAIKKVTSMPVIAAARIDNVPLAESIVAEGKADMVGMARSLLVDAELANKAKEGRIADIRPCILCCRCLDNIMTGLAPECSVNAGLDTAPILPAAQKKKVLVVGGGPAGMETARIAAMRGHQVTLADAGRRLGGLFVLAAVFNEHLEPFNKWLIRQVKGLPIELKMHTTVTPEFIARMKPDVVVVAAGGEPIVPPIPGVNGPNVLGGPDIEKMINGVKPKPGFMWTMAALGAPFVSGNTAFMRKFMGFKWPVKERVIIIGGQFAGLELALTFMELGGRKVTVLEESKRLGSDIGIVSRWVETGMLKKGGVRTETLVKIKEINAKGVVIIKDGKEELIEADTIMTAVGLKENPKLADAVKATGIPTYLIGDAAGGAVRRTREAILDGFTTANKI